jgi:hypothetical protein
MTIAALKARPEPSGGHYDPGEDDDATIEREAMKDEKRVSEVRGACDGLLRALRLYEAYPDEIQNPNIDRR